MRSAYAIASTAAIAIVLGFPSCDDGERDESGFYNARASAACFKKSHPFGGRPLRGWLVSGPDRVESGSVVTVMMFTNDLANNNEVEVLFAESTGAAMAQYRRVADKAAVIPVDRVLQRRANAVLAWYSPETK